ncbi:hypothetical protein COU60_04970 [Candidatus Pacearchaeota archaeon CG10_big_fil_rev_8_21_14_0_10_34_76]|nr:MAG: hypothetical protein COU60_04970 [Candidatus Pacearchaeota archaeon CG10_big_fil_rev_8_21_14_0_10_34_76]
MAQYNIIILVILAFLLITVILISIFLLDRKKKQLKREMNDKNKVHRKSLDKLKKSKKSSSEQVNELDKLSRKFFRDAFHINPNLEYSEIIGFFKKKNKRKIVNYCNSFINLYYTGEKISKNKVKEMISQFDDILRKERI